MDRWLDWWRPGRRTIPLIRSRVVNAYCLWSKECEFQLCMGSVKEWAFISRGDKKCKIQKQKWIPIALDSPVATVASMPNVLWSPTMQAETSLKDQSEPLRGCPGQPTGAPCLTLLFLLRPSWILGERSAVGLLRTARAGINTGTFQSYCLVKLF